MSGRSKFLIIDDEKNICDSCSAVLRAEGWLTEARMNGATGLAAFSEWRPDIVFLDLKMPDLGGLTVLNRILKQDGNAVIVVITGYATIQSAVDSIKQGAFDFLPKPFTPEELRMIARRALERRRLLEEAAALRSEKRRMRESFIAMVSHQLRTPLAAVKQYQDVLLDGIAGVLAPEQMEIITRSQKRIDELLNLIREWLSFSRMDAAAARGEAEAFDLVPLLREILDVTQAAASGKSISLPPLPETPFPVRGVRDLLREALSNVLMNAFLYNREGGEVQIGLEREGGEVRVRISDTGVGIDPDEKPRIFDEFFRGSRNRKIPGTGLGLAIVKRVLERHAGAVEVESEPEKGTTVTLRWPG